MRGPCAVKFKNYKMLKKQRFIWCERRDSNSHRAQSCDAWHTPPIIFYIAQSKSLLTRVRQTVPLNAKACANRARMIVNH